MASYHTSFTYKNENSLAQHNLMIVAFDPDNGFKDSFLSMDNVSDDYYDGTKKINYGSKYNTNAEVQISVIKKDGTDMTLKEFRSYARWLTGARIDSWLDMYIGTELNSAIMLRGNGNSNTFVVSKPYNNISVTIDGDTTNKYKYSKSSNSGLLVFDETPPSGANIIVKESPIYSFLGKVTNLEQYKYDARTTGIRITFSSVSPWAFSSPYSFVCNIGQPLVLNSVGTLYNQKNKMGYDNGVLTPSLKTQDSFDILDNGVVYIDPSYNETINNESDDLYTYIYLDIDYFNDTSDELYIENKTLGEQTIIKGIDPKENISISSKQFIVSLSKTDKIFGSNFNFVWPRLKPGINDFSIKGSGKGQAKFTYRYPMKVGDCAIDIDTYGNSFC